MGRFPNRSHPLAILDEMESSDRIEQVCRADIRRIEATAAYWLSRGLRALAGIEPIRTAPRRN